MRFGSVARDDGSVESFLSQKHDDLAKALKELHGRAELAVKVSWRDRDAIFREILAEDESIRQLRDAIVGRPESETKDQRVELGRQTAGIMEQKRKEEGDRIVERLRPKAVDVELHPLLSESMILNGAFLVERNALGAFDEAVSALGSQEMERLAVKYVGPLPPYSFVKISVSKDQG
jgi:hypothetical protein